ncbi:MAG: hypothetical protein N2Z21_03025 [Candidatus Sumerlaeaceae bacterium]|nr:hypothetical protein [Candidatus Sumerlaeaceae bacterium]
MSLRRVIVAVLVLCALAAIALLSLQRRKTEPQPGASSARIVFERTAAGEIAGELPPTPLMETPSISRKEAEQIRDELAKDKTELLSVIEKTKKDIADEIQQLAKSEIATAGLNVPGEGQVVREIDLSGYPESTVEAVMARYGMRMERRYVNQFTPNTFVSTARVAGGKIFYSSGSSAPGIYDVFELTPRALAKMSTLEEEELRKRGLDPTRCLTSRVVFGIVPLSSGEYDLGVIKLEATPLP